MRLIFTPLSCKKSSTPMITARIKSFYQRKKSKSNAIVAIKTVAHKLCRACYYIMKDQVPFDITKAFA